MTTPLRQFLLIIALVTGAAWQAVAGDAKLDVSLTFDADKAGGPYSGRVYVALAEPGNEEPRELTASWTSPPMLFAIDVEDWTGTTAIGFGASPMGNPGTIDAIPEGTYRAQAFIRLSRYSAQPGLGAGDVYSLPAPVTISKDGTSTLTLHMDQIVGITPVADTGQVKTLHFKSEALSAFHGREYLVDTMVRLPKGWSADSDKTWPVLFYASGFGGSEREALRAAGKYADQLDHVIYVSATATNRQGHSVFADSANTGPWAHFLVNELAPYIDATYGGGGTASRYLTGISSGGWTAIWLMIQHPDAFAGSWAHVPDPVDFRDFQQIDLYQDGSNLFVDAAGNPRPLARSKGKPFLWYEPFVKRELVLGAGGAIQSFEAVFSPRGDDGQPLPFFDRETGAVDTSVTEHWKKYDINLVLKEKWATLGPKIEDKLHIYIGGADTFYLDGAGRLLKADLEALGSALDIQIIEGMPHRFAPGRFGAMLTEITGIAPAADPAD